MTMCAWWKVFEVVFQIRCKKLYLYLKELKVFVFQIHFFVFDPKSEFYSFFCSIHVTTSKSIILFEWKFYRISIMVGFL